VNRPFPLRLPSAFTLFSKLVALRERVAGLFRAPRSERRPARFALEAMEERVVPDARPLPGPVIFTAPARGAVRRW